MSLCRRPPRPLGQRQKKSAMLESNQPVVSLPKRATHLASDCRVRRSRLNDRMAAAPQRVRSHLDATSNFGGPQGTFTPEMTARCAPRCIIFIASAFRHTAATPQSDMGVIPLSSQPKVENARVALAISSFQGRLLTPSVVLVVSSYFRNITNESILSRGSERLLAQGK